MRKKLFYFITYCCCVVFLITGCKKSTPSESIMRMRGNWENPPAYNGNPFLPGGVAAAGNYIYGKLAIYIYLEDEFKNFLADSVTVDGNKLIVKLKKGIFWDDGVPFTSKDVKGQFIFNGGWTATPQIWDYLNSIDTPDDYTIIFNLKEKRSKLVEIYILDETIKLPYHKFEKFMEPAEELLQLRIQGKDKEENGIFQDKYSKLRAELNSYRPEYPLGYGPYKVTKVTASDMVLDKVENYPNNENNDIDKIILSKGNTADIRWAYLRSGLSDMDEAAAPPDVAESILNANKNLKLIIAPYFANLGLFMNQKNELLANVKFRKALAYIIDRDKVRKIGLFYGTTAEMISGVTSSMKDKWIDDTDFNKYDVNLKKAEQLLTEIGLKKNSTGFWCNPDGQEINFEIAGPSGRNDLVIMCEEISRQLMKFGIRNELKLIPPEIYSPLIKNSDYDMTIEHTFDSKKHLYEGYRRMYMDDQWGSIATAFDTVVKDKDGNTVDLAELTENLSETFDTNKQKEIIQTLAWATNEYLPVIDLVEKNSMFFINDGERITNWPDEETLTTYLPSSREPNLILWLLEGQIQSVNKQ